MARGTAATGRKGRREAASAPPPRSSLAEGVRAGDSLSVARAISLAEDRSPEGAALLADLAPSTGRAHRIGVTGPPGAGKSTLVNGLARLMLDGGRTVGIIAVDPTSPFTGGALLGDRVRMQGAAGDPRVFIRSMASRGDLGGLAAAAQDACDVLDAAGKDRIVMETVGVGQTEVEVAGAADTVVVILHPEAGDGVQAMKAGLMEVADVFVVNKADREGADRLVQDVLDVLELRRAAPGDGWRPPVLKTVASTGEGLPALLASVEEHAARSRASGSFDRRRRGRVRSRIRDLVE
ncbi:MAG: methylmalonyl Co-A mutase-associated GTPase MeaB, partial [Planctomycetaceae bacterium]|nr:methylmalonyl Co-A mutase-associated GTPase MeaB [Planctomycetaceae bacterium]